MGELDRRYYDLETHILATTPRCASTSTRYLHQDLPLRTAEWVHKNRNGRQCYGVMRNPLERMVSAWKLLAPKYRWDLTFSQMLEELGDNPHVMQNVDLHRGVVDVWLDFEEYTATLPVHHRKSEDIWVPEVCEDLAQQFYRDDWEVYNELQARARLSVGLDLGVGTTGTSLGRDESEGEHRGSGDDGRSDGLAQRREVPGTPGEAESPGSERAGLGDSGRGDLEREWGTNLWGSDIYGESLDLDAEPRREDG